MFATFDLSAHHALSGQSRAVSAAQLDRICRDTGFLVLRGHGVPQAIIDGVWRMAQSFFAQDPDTKARVAAPYPGYPYG